MPNVPRLLQASYGPIRVAFLGTTSGDLPPEEALSEQTGVPIVLNRQVHSNRVVEVSSDMPPGSPVAEADGLVTESTGLGLGVLTADCVPVLLATEHRIAAVHAGWRGLAAGILDNAAASLRQGDEQAKIVGWVGPAIGGCCYEVGHEVATAVSAVSGGSSVLYPPPPGRDRGRPYLDLGAAAHAQLEAAGIPSVQLHRCTFCDHREEADEGTHSSWHSYRRNAQAAGRNISCIWRVTPPSA